MLNFSPKMAFVCKCYNTAFLVISFTVLEEQ